MNHRLLSLSIVAFALASASATADIDESRIDAHVRYLADDAREGRGPGSEGLEASADYVEKALREAGLQPLFGESFRQSFSAEGNTYRNVGALLAGQPGESAIVIAAHYDHLGRDVIDGEPVIYNGADDNASGVAALLEIAREMAETTAREGPFPRSIVFVAFSAEEQGVLGAAHFVANPPPAAEKTAAMLNLDTVGRLREDRLVVFGSGTGSVFPDMLNGVNRVFRLKLALTPDAHSAGDHVPFFQAGVPVLHFFTDAHPDYHRPSDTADKVNVDGVTVVAAFVAEIAAYLSDESVRPAFVPAGAEEIAERQKPTTRRRRVSFGTIPDFARESGGILVSGLIPGSPAEKAGIATGDVIVEIDGSPIDNLYDYQEVLETREPGDEIRIVYLRAEARHETTATLVKRR